MEEKAKHSIHGIVVKKECSLPVKVSIIKGMLFDEDFNHTKEDKDIFKQVVKRG